ncbi:MAG TPA: hypothetical protein VK983_04595 [Candidatus Limnocylindrales bacterium]|nr:hypothetical protein [Candidatus Limnocylindrales bacterium]
MRKAAGGDESGDVGVCLEGGRRGFLILRSSATRGCGTLRLVL